MDPYRYGLTAQIRQEFRGYMENHRTLREVVIWGQIRPYRVLLRTHAFKLTGTLINFRMSYGEVEPNYILSARRVSLADYQSVLRRRL